VSDAGKAGIGGGGLHAFIKLACSYEAVTQTGGTWACFWGLVRRLQLSLLLRSSWVGLGLVPLLPVRGTGRGPF
jgi:hypothetical protein